MGLPERLRLSSLEIASGSIFGEDRGAPPLPGRIREPLRAPLERSLRRALERQPCLLTFSGGRDSSALLALAVDVARREGLPLPIAVTSRFPEAPATDESAWQERVIAHLRLEDWVRLEHTDELDVVGPVATRLLRRDGLLWPANAHFLAPHAARAAGGSLVTGTGGDQVFEPPRLARHSALLARTVRPRLRDVRRIAFIAAPAPLRKIVIRRRFPDAAPYAWLHPEAQRRVTAAWYHETAREPVRAGARPAWIWRMRALQVGLASLDSVAADAGTRMVHPFLDPDFLAALGRARLPLTGRADAMETIFGGLLPPEILARRTKPMFQEPLWNRHSRAFAERFTGEGVDCTLVDPEALRSFWLDDGAARFRSATLLQLLWLREDEERRSRDDVQQPLGGSLEGVPAPGAPQLQRR